jgi:hypothetical protein
MIPLCRGLRMGGHLEQQPVGIVVGARGSITARVW